jgi:GNAT superfamily N-acetyltransferase
MIEVRTLDAACVELHSHELAQLLLDAHASNMALGLVAPLTPERAADAYRETAARLVPGELVLFGAFDGDRVVGAVQLRRNEAENGRHRGEIQRLVVRADARGQGVGRALMEAATGYARELGLHLLWLTTHADSDAERLYAALGWTHGGGIPDYAQLPDGRLAANVFYYLVL